MRKIEKETLEIINNFKSERYSHLKKLIFIREKELQENLEKDLEDFMNKKAIQEQIEVFKNNYKFDVSVDFSLGIRSYYTDYQALYDNDEIIRDYKIEMQIIEDARNRMKLILQNSDIKSTEYQTVIKTLKKGE